uniref:Uncharacterized protein n=1 Tax=Arundo donax TaxID=35708 RepID=A0A0A9EEU5_ARUDO
MAWLIASRTGFTLSNLQRSRERRQEVLKDATKYPELTAILERA